MKNHIVVRQKSNEPKPTRYFSNKQEKQVANTLEGRQTKNSGATPYDKGDVSLDKFLIECKTKTTPSATMTIHKEWLEKNKHESCFQGKEYSALAFNFGPNEEMYYIVDELTFKTLIERINNNDNSK
jgi:hypothetical protein